MFPTAQTLSSPRAVLLNDDTTYWDVVIVGAGPAGMGVSIALKHAGVENVLVIEKHEVGSSFRRWPKGMRLITPSFPCNAFGTLDLNSVAIGSSPGHFLEVEHPTGFQYSQYLENLAAFFDLNVQTSTEVREVHLGEFGGGFHLQTSRGSLRCGAIVWATGEFQFPRGDPFPGSGHALHSSSITDWRTMRKDPLLVVGGFESGIDSAVQAASYGIPSIVLDKRSPWESNSSDPSGALSPFTKERLRNAYATGRIRLVSGVEASWLEKDGESFRLLDLEGNAWLSDSPPILATGFRFGLDPVIEYFDFRDDGFPLLTKSDESTLVPGLFLAGPTVRHDSLILCFIYKYRQRFAVVAKAVAEKLGCNAESLEIYRRWGMFLDDLSCCG